MSLDSNIYAFALGLVSPAQYYDRPAVDFRGLASDESMMGSGVPSYGGAIPPYGGKRRTHFYRPVGNGFWDDLLSAGKHVITTLGEPLLQEAAKAVPRLAANLMNASSAAELGAGRRAILPPSYVRR